MQRKEKTTGQTRQNLMEAFWELYCERRIEKITVKDIVNKAGYNRSTFYEYFADPYDLLEQLETSLIPNLNQLPPAQVAEESIGMPMDQFMSMYEQNSKYYSVLLGEKGDPAFAGKLKNSIKPIILSALNPSSIDEKALFDYTLEYTLSAMIGVMSYWFSQNNPISEEKLYNLIRQLNTDGVFKHLKA